MNIDFNKTKEFIKMVIQETDIPVKLKYLITPLNMHEAPIFLDWAVTQRSNAIELVDAAPLNYIKLGMEIPFWETIIARTGHSLREALKKNADALNNLCCTVGCSAFTRDYLGINQEFASSIGWTTYRFYA